MDRAVALLPLLVSACATEVIDGSDDEVLEVAAFDEAAEAKADRADGADVELKVTLRPDQIEAAVARFKLTEGKATKRKVTFFDTPDLALYGRGLILRARDGDDEDSTIKVRPLARADVPEQWFEVGGFKCEEDRVGTRGVSSCSLTVAQDDGETAAVIAGERAVAKLFSKDQEAFAAEHADVPWDDLVALGPTSTRLWKVRVRGFSERLTFERWKLPDDTLLLEVSCRVTAARADAVQARMTKYLEAQGLDTGSAQETKTKAALEYYASHEQ